jgi:hypothetical protein
MNLLDDPYLRPEPDIDPDPDPDLMQQRGVLALLDVIVCYKRGDT